MPHSAVSAATAVARLRRCVVGLTHRWADTARALAFWFPWLDVAAASEVRANAGYREGTVETRETLRPALRALIEDANPCDFALWTAAETQFEEQLQVLDATWE